MDHEGFGRAGRQDVVNAAFRLSNVVMSSMIVKGYGGFEHVVIYISGAFTTNRVAINSK